MDRGRGDLFFSFSLNDFIITLLFLILLLCLWSLKTKVDELARCKGAKDLCNPTRITRLEEEVAMIRAILERAGQDPKEVERLILVTLRDAQRLQDLETAKSRLEHKKHMLHDKVQTLKRSLARVTDGNGARVDVGSIVKQRDEIMMRYRACAAQMKECGLGNPPCWSDENGKVQYIYAVTIEEDGISALATWPAGRAVDAQAIQGAVALPGLHLSREEFGRRAAPVLAWSKAQNPECRQYVYIIDEAETKQAFKRNLLFVEDYFYKYLERDRSKHRPVQTADGAPRLLPESPSSPSGTK